MMQRSCLSLVLLCALAACGVSEPNVCDFCVDACPSGLDDEACRSALLPLLQPLSLPAARGNDVAEDEAAAVLGFHVFFDLRFSHDRNVRCESCHSVDYGFADNTSVPTAGAGPGVRNSPTIFNAARHTVFMWDGRADTLWSQPLLALEDPDEMNFTRLEIVHTLNAFYTADYSKAFGSLPDFSDLARFPAIGKPGDPAFEAMSDDDQREVDRAVANMGKALEAYMRKLATGPSSVDRYLADRFEVDMGYAALREGKAASDLLSRDAQRGAVVFVTSGCLDCHSGPQLSDDQFHNLGVPSLPGKAPDDGRTEAAVDQLRQSPFNTAGPFFDGTPEPVAVAAAPGGFRTPTLRNLTRSVPYGHNGVFATLEEVVDHHLAGGANQAGTIVTGIDPKLRKVVLSEEDRAALIAFLKSLDGSYPALPWGQWPSGNG